MPLESMHHTGLQHHVVRLLVMVAAMTLAGTLGYMALEGWGAVESLYMTVITLSTVGFSEVHELSDGGRLFTTLLIVGGVGAVAYSFGSIGQYLISGELRGTMRRRRMQTRIDRLSEHFVICGFGRVGKQVAFDLEEQGQSCLVIDSNPECLRGEPDDRLAVIGDATDDEELMRCGVARARGLVAATGDDAMNTFITLTARSLNPALVIVARCNLPATEHKLLKAGANHVMLPYSIAGHRIAAQLLHPSVVDFLDVVMHSGKEEIWLAEVEIRPDAALEGKTLVESDINRRVGVNVLALRRRGKSAVEKGPVSDSRLEGGDILIALGTQEQLDALRRLA